MAFVTIIVLFALITIYHDQIVDWLKPLAEYLRDECVLVLVVLRVLLIYRFSITVGWLIPIGILFVLSFPPVRSPHRCTPDSAEALPDSSLAMKSSPFCAGWSGDYGSALALLQLAPS